MIRRTTNRTLRLGWKIRALLLVQLFALTSASGSGQSAAKGFDSDTELGTDCAYVNAFAGAGIANGGSSPASASTAGVTFGQYLARTWGKGFAASPQFELGVAGPLPRGTALDGLVSVNGMFASKVPGHGLYPSVTVGYTRMFVTGNAVNFGFGVDFGKDEYDKLFRVELRDYYLFTGPRQHVFQLRFGLGKFVAD